MIRRGYRPRKIAFLAMHAWADADGRRVAAGLPRQGRPAYDLVAVRRWLDVFVRRFFGNQFKRCALPNGPR